MGTLIHALEKRLREREREDHSAGARPLNLLNIALHGLASLYLHLCPFYLHLGGRTLAPRPLLHACTCKDKINELENKQRNKCKEKHAKDKLGKVVKQGHTNMSST